MNNVAVHTGCNGRGKEQHGRGQTRGRRRIGGYRKDGGKLKNETDMDGKRGRSNSRRQGRSSSNKKEGRGRVSSNSVDDGSTRRNRCANGFERAVIYNTCDARWSHFRHHINVVYSDAHMFTFLDNVKAGSTTIRELLGHSLGDSWFKMRDGDKQNFGAGNSSTYEEKKAAQKLSAQKESKRLLRYVTTDYTLAQLNATFKFSMARDPVEKFESGVRQTWFQNPALANLTADELLDKQLAMPFGSFLNEHLHPTTYQLSGWSKRAAAGGWRASGWSARGIGAMALDFVGALETFNTDWKDVVGKISRISKVQRKRLLETKIGNSRHDVEGRSRLSEAAVQRMCTSEMYGDEWRCLGYASPC